MSRLPTRAELRHRLGFAAAALRAPLPEPEPAPRSTEHIPLAVLDSLQIALARDLSDFHSMRRLLAFSLGPADSCIDIGAHQGGILTEMVRVAPRGRHMAFEPIPQLAERLAQDFPGVEVHQAAVSDVAGEAEFVHVISDNAEGWSGLKYRPLPTGETPEVEHITVKLEVLDELLPADFAPKVIKIDVEGAELQVLRGARETLRRHRPTLLLEHGTGSAEAFGTTPGLLYELLGELEYRIYDLDGNGPYTQTELEHSFHTGERVNWVARP